MPENAACLPGYIPVCTFLRARAHRASQFCSPGAVPERSPVIEFLRRASHTGADQAQNTLAEQSPPSTMIDTVRLFFITLCPKLCLTKHLKLSYTFARSSTCRERRSRWTHFLHANGIRVLCLS